VYVALVWGHPEVATGLIDAPIGRDQRDPTKMAVVIDGKFARTHYDVKKKFELPQPCALVECQLETGRTHQIRVHLDSIENPVVGDSTYGGARSSLSSPRPMLHAAKLSFVHPTSGEVVTFEAPVPQDGSNQPVATGEIQVSPPNSPDMPEEQKAQTFDDWRAKFFNIGGGTVSFQSTAGDVYGYYVTRANNMPVSVQGVVNATSIGIGTTVSKGDNTFPTIGVVGNYYFTINGSLSVDDITLGQIVSGNVGVQTGSRVIGIDRALKVVYIDLPLIDNIQVATDPSVDFRFSKCSVAGHGLVSGDILYIAAGTGNTTHTSNPYTVFSVPNANEFYTTPALSPTLNTVAGLNTCTLYSNVMYAERFTNGPYTIQNNGDQIKITLNVALD
jgi:hypothetical protein